MVLGFITLVAYFQSQKRKQDTEAAHNQELQRTSPLRSRFQPLVSGINWPTDDGNFEEIEPKAIGRGIGTSSFRTPCVVLDLSTKDVWLPWCSWPIEVRAESPESVQTVVVVEPIKHQTIRYTDGTPGYRQDFKVWLLDPTSQRIKDRRLLLGGNPPQTITVSKFDFAGKAEFGSPPDLQRWLTNLIGF